MRTECRLIYCSPACPARSTHSPPLRSRTRLRTPPPIACPAGLCATRKNKPENPRPLLKSPLYGFGSHAPGCTGRSRTSGLGQVLHRRIQGAGQCREVVVGELKGLLVSTDSCPLVCQHPLILCWVHTGRNILLRIGSGPKCRWQKQSLLGKTQP